MEILTQEEQSIKLQIENKLKNCNAKIATKFVSDKIREQYKPTIVEIIQRKIWKHI